jgi:hypothetical protein
MFAKVFMMVGFVKLLDQCLLEATPGPTSHSSLPYDLAFGDPLLPILACRGRPFRMSSG